MGRDEEEAMRRWRGRILASMGARIPSTKDPFEKCREQDSNLHTFRYQNLNLARLPIPPSRLADES